MEEVLNKIKCTKFSINKAKRKSEMDLFNRFTVNFDDSINAQPDHILIKRDEVALEAWHTKLGSDLAVLILSPSPRFGGTAFNGNVLLIERAFQALNASTIRVNYSGVGLSTGQISDEANLRDALDLTDWISDKINPKQIWVAGYGYGAFLAIHTSMRVPNISGFIAITPFIEQCDFNLNFLTPCPNGLIINGVEDQISHYLEVKMISQQLLNQKGCSISFESIEGADHCYTNHKNELKSIVANYLANAFGVEMETNTIKQAKYYNK